jgi:hypothetical protein
MPTLAVRRVAVASLAGVLTAGACLLPAVTAAGATTTSLNQATRAGGGWLARQFNSGGFVRSSSGRASVSLTAQAVVALDAAGVGATQAAAALTWLEGHFESYVHTGPTDDPGSLAIVALAAEALGANPYQFASTTNRGNLIQRILKTQQSTGNDAGLFGTADPTLDMVYRQSLALLALSGAGVNNVNGNNWLVNQQCSNGPWMSYRADTSVACPPPDPSSFTGPDTNSTALAVEALSTSHVGYRSEVFDWLAGLQNDDGGWGYLGTAGQATDPDSTALVIQALVAAGKAPASARYTTATGATPFSALLSFEVGCSAARRDRGAFGFAAGADPDLFATIQAVPAVARAPLPVASQPLSTSTPYLHCS